MTEVATWFALLMLALATLLTVSIAALHIVRLRWSRRRARRARAPRRALLAVAAEPDPAGVEQLVRMSPGQWRAVEPVALELLGTIRGEGHAALGEVFERRAVTRQAREDLRRVGALRRARSAALLGRLHSRAAVADLCALLDDPHPEVRVACVQALGQIGDPAAVYPLLASVGRSSPTPALQVAHALAQLGQPAVSGLRSALADPRPLVRATALDALRLLGAAEAEPDLVALLRDDPSTEVRVRAAVCLRRIGTETAIAPLLASAAATESAPLRVAAIEALGELGIRTAQGELALLLSSSRYPVAHAAADALLALGQPGRNLLLNASGGAGSAAAHAREALARAALAAQRARTASRPVPTAGSTA